MLYDNMSDATGRGRAMVPQSSEYSTISKTASHSYEVSYLVLFSFLYVIVTVFVVGIG